MQYIIIIAILIFLLILLAILFDFNLKKIKELGNDKVLDEMVRRFPSNKQICQYILNKLGNNHTKIKENKDSKTSLYLIFNDTISIANINDTYTRVQTIAHECLHSIQNKKILWFNFIFSNICIITYLAVFILTILGIIKNGMLWIAIILILTLISYIIRSYLEMDAMIKARYLAKEYMEKNKLTSQGNINIILKNYDKLNDLGIKAICFALISKEIVKITLYCLICFIKIG